MYLIIQVGEAIDSVFMVMEYCYIDLAHLMDTHISPGDSLSTPQVKNLLHQLLTGVGKSIFLNQWHMITLVFPL